MRNRLKITAGIFGIIALGIVGCKKEATISNPTLANSESEIQSLVLQTDNENVDMNVTFDEISGLIAAYNDGIAADYLVNVGDFDEFQSTPNSTNSQRTDIRNRSFIPCIKSVKLDSTQIRNIRRAMRAYEDCKNSTITRARNIHQTLQQKYKSLVQDQTILLRAGTITKQEFEERMARLRKAFQKELRDLQLKDKATDSLKRCQETFLRQIHNILSDRQWNAFIGCRKK